MFDGYRSALALPGAVRFSSAGLVARLPNSIETLGIVLLVSGQTGSYALAGALSAAYQLAVAVGAPLTSRLADRRGQTGLLTVLCLANAALIALLVLLIVNDSPAAASFAVAALGGLTQPAIGSMVRARWAAIAPDAPTLRSAFALESVLDELVFTVGPLLTSVLAFGVGLPAPLVVASALVLVGGLALAMQRRTAPPPAAPAEHGERGVLGHPALFLVVVAALGIGGVFGMYEVSVVAFTAHAGQPGMSGVVLGLWAFGSMLGGIVFGGRHWAGTLPRQALVLCGLLSVALVPSVLVRQIPLLMVATFVAGVLVAPALISAFSLTERLVPVRLLTESLTWATSGLTVGFAAGTAVAGIVVDAHGPTLGFALAVGSALGATAVVAAGQRSLSRSVRPPEDLPPAASIGPDPVAGPTPGTPGPA